MNDRLDFKFVLFKFYKDCNSSWDLHFKAELMKKSSQSSKSMSTLLARMMKWMHLYEERSEVV